LLQVFLHLERDEETDGTMDNLSKKMVRNRALSRSLSLQSKSTSYQSLQNEGGIITTTGLTGDVPGKGRGRFKANSKSCSRSGYLRVWCFDASVKNIIDFNGVFFYNQSGTVLPLYKFNKRALGKKQWVQKHGVDITVLICSGIILNLRKILIF
jgi:hypothetical protein